MKKILLFKLVGLILSVLIILNLPLALKLTLYFIFGIAWLVSNPIVLIGLFALVVFLNTATGKGFIGELVVNLIIRSLNKEDYRLYHDLYIPKADKTTTQIDHVVVSKFGVFVIETKNYKGWIFGDERSKKWTQVIYRKKSTFYNPIMQNKGHIRSLSVFLDIERNMFVSIIVFTTRATLKKSDDNDIGYTHFGTAQDHQVIS